MKFKLRIHHLIILALLLVVFRVYLLKFIYLMILPGFCILLLLSLKFDFNKTLLLSLPASIILYIYPYFLITRSLFPIPVFIYFLIPAVLAYIVYRKRLFTLEFKSIIDFKSLFYMLLPIIVLLIIYYPYSIRSEISLTAGSNVLLFLKINAERIISEGRVPIWTQAEYGGSHYFYTYPPLAHVSTALLNAIPTESINYTINLTIIILYLYMLFAAYMLFNYLGLGDDASILGVSIMIGVPILAGEATFSGNITMVYMFSLYPAAVYGFLNIFKKNNLKEILVLALTVAAFMTVYHYIGYFMLLPAFFTLILYLIFSKPRKELFKNSLIFFTVIALLFSAWFIRYYLTKDFISIKGWEGSWNTPLKDFDEFLSYISSTGLETDDVYKQVITFTPLFFWLGIASMFLLLRVKGRRFHFLGIDLLLFTYFALTFFLIICEIFPFHVYLPLRINYYHVFKFWAVLVPLFAFSIARLYENLTGFFNFKPLIFIAFILMFSSMIALSSENVSNWLHEDTIIVEDRLSGLNDVLKQLPDRVALFGGFGPGLIPSIQNWTKSLMMKGYGYQRHSPAFVYENLLEPFTEASMDYIKEGTPPLRMYNSFKVSGTNTIVLFTCDSKGSKALNVITAYPGYELKARSDCLTILSLEPASSLVEKVLLTRVTAGNEVRKTVLNHSGGYNLVMPYYELDSNEYGFEVDEDFILAGNYSSINYETNELSYEFLSDESLMINAVPGWILFKGGYFPTMHAYQSGKELLVTPTFHGMTLIKSLSDESITLVHSPHYSETIGLLIYLVFIALLLVIYLRCK